jgi:putative chitinase
MHETGFSKLNEPAVSGQDRVLEFQEEDPEVNDVRWAAYMLAVVKHESADRWHTN